MADRSGQNKTKRNSIRAEQRRRVSRTIGALREQMSSISGIRLVFDHELTTMYARNNVASVLAFMLMTVAFGVIGCLWIDPRLVAGWVFIVLMARTAQYILAKRYLDRDVADDDMRRWQQRFIIAEGFVGSALALLIIALARGDAALDVFQFAVMLIVVAVGTMLSSNIPNAMLAGTLPIVIATAIAFTSKLDILGYAMAVVTIGSEAFFLTLGHRLFTNTLMSLEFQTEKDSLIAELEQANAISDDSRRRAEEANLAKSRFLATMSHELRTPLNAILGFSEVMKSEVLGPLENNSYKEYVNDIHSSGKHLLTLINEILDLSRIEAGRYDLSEEAVSLPYLADECRHLMKLKANSKDITIYDQVEPDLPKIWADERSIRQVILNLLSNAVKFTPTGGTILIRVGWTAGGGQYVSVSDNGPGIPEDEIPIVLSAFGQGAIAHNSAEAGTGLGLSIVQALVYMHEGKFDIYSKLREGTTVTVSFPRARVMEPMPAFEQETRPKKRRAVA